MSGRTRFNVKHGVAGRVSRPSAEVMSQLVVVLIGLSGDESADIRSALEVEPGFVSEVFDTDTMTTALQFLENLEVSIVVVDGNVLGGQPSSFRWITEAARNVPVVVVVDSGVSDLGYEVMTSGASAFLVRGEDDRMSAFRVLKSALVRYRTDIDRRSSEERLSLAFEGSNRGLWDWDLLTDRVFYCKRWCSLLGLDEAEIVDDPKFWIGRVHAKDRSMLTRALQAYLNGEQKSFSCEFRMQRSRGDYRWFFAQGMVACDSQGSPIRIAGCLSDINAQRTAEQQILHDAMHDGLTGLPNRAVFVDRVSLALARLNRRTEAGFAVLFLDLDSFKQVNDTVGHATGDRLLISVSKRLEKAVRPQDTVCRLCGDEFAVLLADATDAMIAAQVADRIVKSMARVFVIDGHEVSIGISIGITMSLTGYQKADQMLHDADVAMYRSKAMGGRCHQIFDADMHRATRALLCMEAELRTAVNTGSFVMHYQPIVSLDTEKIVGFEGLVRWRHPERGLITPSKFLAVAEATGLIVPIGWWALEQACYQMHHWNELFPSDPPLWLSINVTSDIFVEDQMIDRLLGILYASRLAPENLRLELKENVVAIHGERAIATLLELRALGVRLSVDDFGDGFLTLKFLDQISFDSVKIDPSFVNLVDADNHKARVVETILRLADGLGMSVIAEGVERSSQCDRLRHLRCPEGQGYWFSRPVAPKQVEQLLAAGPAWRA